MQKIAVLSFSGGMDSSSLLFQILTEGYTKVYCYSFDYGQRHSIEIEKSQELVQALNRAGFDVNLPSGLIKRKKFRKMSIILKT